MTRRDPVYTHLAPNPYPPNIEPGGWGWDPPRLRWPLRTGNAMTRQRDSCVFCDWTGTDSAAHYLTEHPAPPEPEWKRP